MKKIWVSVLLACMLFAGGCADVNNMDDADGDIEAGIVCSGGSRGTLVKWVDEDFNVLTESKYGFTGTGNLAGYHNAEYDDDGNPVLLSFDEKKGGAKLLILDRNSGDVSEKDCDADFVTSWGMDGNSAVMASNVNAKSYVDAIDTADGTKKHFKAREGTFIDNVCAAGDEIYAMSEDGKGRIRLVRLDMENNKAQELMDIDTKTMPSFLLHDGGCLYYIDEKKLVRYDTGAKKVKKVQLSGSRGHNIKIEDDLIWIAYTDIHDVEAESVIEARNKDSGEVVSSCHTSGPVWGLEADGNKLYALKGDRVEKYEIEGHDLRRKAEVKNDEKKHTMTGVFLMK